LTSQFKSACVDSISFYKRETLSLYRRISKTCYKTTWCTPELTVYTADSCYNSQNGLAFTRRKMIKNLRLPPAIKFPAYGRLLRGAVQFYLQNLDANGAKHPRQANFFCACRRDLPSTILHP